MQRSLSSAALYGSANILQIPFSGLFKEFVVTRTRAAMLYRDSRDPKVAAAGIEVSTGRKWSTALIGMVARGPGLLSKQSGGHSHRKEATTSPPGGSACRCAQTAGSLDKVGEHAAAEDLMARFVAG